MLSTILQAVTARAFSLFIVVLLIVAILSGIGGYWLGENRLLPQLSFVSVISPTPIPNRVGGVAATPSPTATPSAIPTPVVDPGTVVSNFMTNFTKAAPPNNVNGTEAQTAKGLLTTNAQKVLSGENSESLVSGLAKFANVQNIPDGGYTVGKPTITDDTAVVATTWNFLSGPVTKVFYLIKENNVWKIDAIRDR